jgi:putative spermidine/putrescine transport system ATP-binding protein
MSVRKNIGFGLAMRGVPKAEARRRVDEALRLIRLKDHGEKLPGQLSGGQQQRVAIARAVVIEPPLVLMDEPLSNLDAKLRLDMRTEIKRIHRELGRSTIYVTHDQEEALSLADRIVVLHDGRARQIGTPEELYARPADLDIARFMGYRNILDATVERVENGRAHLTAAGVSLLGTVQGAPRPGPAVLAIRPEDLRPGAGAFEGRVDTVEYAGRDYLVELVLPSGETLHARSPARIGPGEELACTVAPERALVFPAK